MLTGGCACGAVRYRLSAEPYDTGWCHCTVCQRVSGSAGMVFTTVAIQHFIVEQGIGRLGHFRSTSFGERGFCQDCGAPLTIHVRHQPAEIDIAAGSLDDPGAVAPGFHLYVESAPIWAAFDDGLPQYAQLRPNTRGLVEGRTEA